MTVSNPDLGEWSLDAAVDPDNRVMIVTNLNLKVDSLPNNLLMGDELVIRSRLLQEHKTITNKKLLSLMHFSVYPKLNKINLPLVNLFDNGQGKDSFAGDGVFSGTVGHFTKPGIYEVNLMVVSDTFNREVHHRLEVRGSPARIEVKKKETGFETTIHVDPSMLRSETVSIQLKLPDGQSLIIPQAGELEWTTIIPVTYEKQEITATLVGTRFNGKEMHIDLTHILGEAGNQVLKVKLPEDIVKNSATAVIDKKVDKNQHQVMDEHGKSDEKTDNKNNDGLDWVNVGGVFVIVNVLVLILIVIIAIIIKKRRAKKGVSNEADEVDIEL